MPHWVVDVPNWVSPHETTIILPIKNENNLRTVVAALRHIAPETILFLKTLESIEISVHLPQDNYEVVIEKHIQAVSGESKQVELTYLRRNGTESGVLESSLYWVTEVEFPKPTDVQHEKRADMEDEGFVSDSIGTERG